MSKIELGYLGILLIPIVLLYLIGLLINNNGRGLRKKSIIMSAISAYVIIVLIPLESCTALFKKESSSIISNVDLFYQIDSTTSQTDLENMIEQYHFCYTHVNHGKHIYHIYEHSYSFSDEIVDLNWVGVIYEDNLNSPAIIQCFDPSRMIYVEWTNRYSVTGDFGYYIEDLNQPATRIEYQTSNGEVIESPMMKMESLDSVISYVSSEPSKDNLLLDIFGMDNAYSRYREIEKMISDNNLINSIYSTSQRVSYVPLEDGYRGRVLTGRSFLDLNVYGQMDPLVNYLEYYDYPIFLKTGKHMRIEYGLFNNSTPRYVIIGKNDSDSEEYLSFEEMKNAFYQLGEGNEEKLR